MKYPQRLTENVTLLGNRHFSVYLVRRSDFYTLIECGISSIAEQVIRQITSLGVDVSKIRDLILTHAHADHITGAPVLKGAMPWISVKTTSETRDLLLKDKIQAHFLKDDMEIVARLAKLNVIDGAGVDKLSLEHLVDETIMPGQILEDADAPIELLDAPGHCKGGIALWQPKSKMLFCSDYLGFHLPPDKFVANFYVDYDDFLKTFEFLGGLKPVWICPGHCGAYAGEDAVRYMALSKAELKWVYDYVAENCVSPWKIETARKALFDRYYVYEATMFSPESAQYCVDLLIRRILNSKAVVDSQSDQKRSS